jgi:hypothetical protein
MVQRDGVWQKALSEGLLHRGKEKLALAHLMEIFRQQVILRRGGTSRIR